MRPSVCSLQVSPRPKRHKSESLALPAAPLRPCQVQVRAVLPDWVKGEPPLAHVAALRLKDKRHTSQAVKQLSLALPVPALTHLKRVRRVPKEEVGKLGLGEPTGQDAMLIYLNFAKEFNIAADTTTNLAALGELDVSRVFAQLENTGVDTQHYTRQVFVCRAALHPPRLREVYDKVTNLWPCVFHEDAYLTRLASDTFFTSQEIENITTHMNKTIEAGRQANDAGSPPIGCVIVNEVTGEVCVAQDNRFSHPLQHAAMVGVDMVAVMQGGGVWTRTPSGCKNDETLTHSSQSCNEMQSTSSSSLPCKMGTENICNTLQSSEIRTENPSSSNTQDCIGGDCKDETHMKDISASNNTNIAEEKGEECTNHTLPHRKAMKTQGSDEREEESRDDTLPQMKDKNRNAYNTNNTQENDNRRRECKDVRAQRNKEQEEKCKDNTLPEKRVKTSNTSHKTNTQEEKRSEHKTQVSSDRRECIDNTLSEIRDKTSNTSSNTTTQESEEMRSECKEETSQTGDNISTSNTSNTQENEKLSERKQQTSQARDINTNTQGSNGTPYICTGCDVYLSHEPCMMCAMALLHSRVRRVFYLRPDPSLGALGSRVKLHTLQGINHRYEVFTVHPSPSLE